MKTGVQITFDIFSIITALGAAQGIFFSIAIFGRRTGNIKANRVMALLIFLISASLNYGIIMPTNLVYYVPHLLLTDQPMVFIEGPLILLYVNYFTVPGYRITKKTMLVFVPAVVCVIALSPFYLMSGAEKIAQRLAYHQGDVFTLDQVTWILAQVNMWVYFILSWLKINKHQKKMKDNYSTLEKMSLAWIKYIIELGAAVFLLFGTVTFIELAGFLTLNFDLERTMFVFTAFVLYLYGYKGYQQSAIVLPPGEVSSPEKKYEKSGLTKQEAGRYKEKLIELMSNEKPYRNPDLTLDELAEKLSLSRNNLSQVINNEMSQNFYDFINSYRIEDIKEKIGTEKYRDTSFLDMALESGFNSKSTFNTIFKKYTGRTPSEYKRSIRTQ